MLPFGRIWYIYNLHYEKFADGTVKCIEDEIPFELPDGWAWCRSKDLFNVCSAKRVLQSEWRKEGIPFYRAREIVKLSNNGYVDNDLFISLDHYETLKKTYGVPQVGDLMVTGVGTIGKVYVVRENDTFYYKDASVLCFENRYGAIESEYARIMIDSPILQEQIHSQTYGNTVDTITISTANDYLCVLPPINEQRKIIDAVKNILEITALIEDGNAEIKSCVTQAKSKILDFAIRGKLVPQNPDDEPASVLLERIRAEKEELIRQGKIKRDKKESVIFKGEDNSYYDEIPENWSITTLNQLTHTLLLNDGDWILSENMNSQGEVKLIQLGSVGMMRYVDKGFKYLTEITFKELNCTQIYPGYMLINRIVSDKMCSCILPQIEGKLITTVDTCWVAPKEEWYSLKYLMYTLSSPTIQSLVMLNSAGTTRKRISKNNLINLPFAFPPLDEQHRIVETIENAFAQLDAISDSLN